MKNYFISLFKSEQIKTTITLFVGATLLISFSLLIGISDNIPMIAMLFTGIIFLFFTILHPWEQANYFAFLGGFCLVILILDFLFPFISEGFAMTVGFICLAGIITGIIGIFTRIKSWRRLPYTGSLLSLLALLILISLRPMREIFTPEIAWILISLQLLITILLFVIGIINKRDSRVIKGLLIVSAVVLILLCICGIYASTKQFESNSIVFDKLMLRIYAVTEIIIASLSGYACR